MSIRALMRALTVTTCVATIAALSTIAATQATPAWVVECPHFPHLSSG